MDNETSVNCEPISCNIISRIFPNFIANVSHIV